MKKLYNVGTCVFIHVKYLAIVLLEEKTKIICNILATIIKISTNYCITNEVYETKCIKVGTMSYIFINATLYFVPQLWM